MPPAGTSTSYVVSGASGASGAKFTIPICSLYLPEIAAPPIGRTTRLVASTLARSMRSLNVKPTRVVAGWRTAPGAGTTIVTRGSVASGAPSCGA